MQIFIDTSNIDLITKWNQTGIIDGVTTNPALLSQEAEDPITILSKISEIMEDRPVSAQVTASNHKDMFTQGLKLSAISNNIIIKLPANFEGFQALQLLNNENIKTNITLCFDPVTASLFSSAGATYVSMILGRTDDFNLQQSSLIERTKKIFINSKTETKILAASFRSPHQVELAMAQGADVLTIPPSTMDMVFNNPLTLSGLGDFANAWKKLSQKDRDQYEQT